MSTRAAATAALQDFAFGGAVCAAGDVAAQALGAPLAELELDARRTAVVGAYGAVVCAPCECRQFLSPCCTLAKSRSPSLTDHYWYKFLASSFPGADFRAVARKTACELLVALPLFEVPAFTLWSGYFAQGATLGENVAALRAGWAPAVVAGWGIWGPASLATFSLVQAPRNQLRVLYLAGCTWACAISWLSFRRGGAQEDRVAARTES